MLIGVEVSGGVPRRRIVTTSDMAALLADSKVHPVVASNNQTVLAPF